MKKCKNDRCQNMIEDYRTFCSRECCYEYQKSDAFRQSQSKTMSDYYKNNPVKESTKEKLSIRGKERFSNPEERERMRILSSTPESIEIRRRKYQEWLKNHPEFRNMVIENNRRLQMDPEYREIMNKVYSSQEWKESMKSHNNKYWSDPQNLKYHSDLQKLLWEDENFRNRCLTGNGGYHNSPKAGKVHYRSSWELHAYQLLDQMSIVKTYKVEPFAIPYKWSDGEFYNYYPDLLVEYTTGEKEIIEIKPEYFLLDEVNIAKFDAAREYCNENGMKFNIWTEQTLFGGEIN